MEDSNRTQKPPTPCFNDASQLFANLTSGLRRCKPSGRTGFQERIISEGAADGNCASLAWVCLRIFLDTLLKWCACLLLHSLRGHTQYRLAQSPYFYCPSAICVWLFWQLSIARMKAYCLHRNRLPNTEAHLVIWVSL